MTSLEPAQLLCLGSGHLWGMSQPLWECSRTCSELPEPWQAKQTFLCTVQLGEKEEGFADGDRGVLPHTRAFHSRVRRPGAWALELTVGAVPSALACSVSLARLPGLSGWSPPGRGRC